MYFWENIALVHNLILFNSHVQDIKSEFLCNGFWENIVPLPNLSSSDSHDDFPIVKGLILRYQSYNFVKKKDGVPLSSL